MGRFFVYQYHAHIGPQRLPSTYATNPSTCWKKLKAMRKMEAMPHREAVKELRGMGFNVRRTGKTECS